MFIETEASIHSIVMRKPIFGVGFNDAEYITSKSVNGKMTSCPFYRKWIDMMVRCYSYKYQKGKPSYIGCRVDKEWLYFSNFKSWMIKQDWQDKELDKDILSQGNKIYSPENCIFVTSKINSLLKNVRRGLGSFPIGVTYDKNSKKYLSRCSSNGKSEYLGLFNTPKEAHEAYKKFKYKLISDVANKQTEPLKSALLNYKIGE